MSKNSKRETKKSVMNIDTVLEHTDNNKITKQQLMTNLRRSEFKIEFKNKSQEKIWSLIDKKEITFCCGPAGTGKSFISIAKAINLVLKEKGIYKRIIIVKPIVESEEKLGFLPGDVNDKIFPYIYSTLYIMEKILGKNKTEALLKNEIIQPMALAYMRGINIDDSVVIVEEAQNMTKKSMRTLLTRIGENSKFIINGDLEQSDLYNNPEESGLFLAMNVLTELDEIGIVKFGDDEIIRNPLIGKILKKLNGNFK